MERSKVLAVLVALVAAGAAAVAFAGGASAASWHVYQGDMHAGHAYGLQVPADAESIEFSFEGDDGGKATIGVYEPGGDKVGSYALSEDLTAARIADPAVGQYVVYVYDVVDGALSVRVASEDEPALELAEIELLRSETEIGTFPAGRLDQIVTTKLDAEPVFLTLLYKGSARNMDATVASESGTVVRILGETASAFSPGVWTSQRGERTFDPAGLDGVTYTVEAHAEMFEGTMVLTTLTLDLPEVDAAHEHALPISHTHDHPEAPEARAAKPAPLLVEGPAVFAIEQDAPVAFQATAGKLLLSDPDSEACERDDEEHAQACYDVHALVTIYAPDDSVLAVVDLGHETHTAEVELPVAGEYVAFARSIDGDDVVLAQIVGSTVAPELTVLATEEEIVTFGLASFEEGSEDFTLEHVPLAMRLDLEDGVGTLANLVIENERGVAAYRQDIATLGAIRFADHTYEDPGMFMSGAHTLRYGGLYEGSLVLTSLHYVRGEVAAEEVVEETAEEPEEPAEPGEPQDPSGVPLPVGWGGLAQLLDF